MHPPSPSPSSPRKRDRHQEPAAGRSRRPAPAHGRQLRILLWTVRLLLSGALAVGVGYLPYRLYLRSGLAHFVSLRAELSQLVERNRKLQLNIVELRAQLERFEEDSEAVERVARDELGMVRSGEVIFKVE